MMNFSSVSHSGNEARSLCCKGGYDLHQIANILLIYVQEKIKDQATAPDREAPRQTVSKRS